jgi:hypothetical protein
MLVAIENIPAGQHAETAQASFDAEVISKLFDQNHTEQQALELIRVQVLNDSGYDDAQWEAVKPDAVKIVADVSAKRNAARREQQRQKNRDLGHGSSDDIPKAEVHTLAEMRGSHVYVADGCQVVSLENRAVAFKFHEFESLHQASRHPYRDENGRPKSMPVPQAWLMDRGRKTVHALTWRPGAGDYTVNPLGVPALNQWEPRHRPTPPANWEQLAQVFVDHVTWLWGADVHVFLDWLAHIVQKPGELPHFHFLHIARIHGMGRNWLASVLTRVLAGNVAASFDLIAALDSGFNARLSRCRLAIVDEICEGGSIDWRHNNALRQLLTAEYRQINPKYGRQTVEYNCARFLMFSNHTDALPIGAEDRRIWVVESRESPREPEYYSRLYKMLDNPAFIAAVIEYLHRRDISAFNPGQRPPMTEAKAAMVAMSKSDGDRVAEAVAEYWPVDIIYQTEFLTLLDTQQYGQRPSAKAVAHMLDRAGIRRCDKRQVRDGDAIETAYIVRNYEVWSSAEGMDLRNERNRTHAGKTLADLTGEPAEKPKGTPNAKRN